jgi:hypothetical protein
MIGQRSSGNPTKDLNQHALPTAAVAAGAAQRSRSSNEAQGVYLPWVYAGLVVLYLVYAVIEQHEKLKSAIEPKNIGINLRNIAVILVPVILGINLLKILSVKLVAWGVPGAKYFVAIVGNA